MDLEADRFQNLSYAEPAFRTEAGAVLGEYQNNAYSAFSVLDRAVRETIFTTHTYRHQTIGFEADIRDMPNQYEYSLEFFRRFYRPDADATLAAASDARVEVPLISPTAYAVPAGSEEVFSLIVDGEHDGGSGLRVSGRWGPRP